MRSVQKWSLFTPRTKKNRHFCPFAIPRMRPREKTILTSGAEISYLSKWASHRQWFKNSEKWVKSLSFLLIVVG